MRYSTFVGIDSMTHESFSDKLELESFDEPELVTALLRTANKQCDYIKTIQILYFNKDKKALVVRYVFEREVYGETEMICSGVIVD